MQAKILKSTALFSGFVLLAQVLGLVRDLYLTRIFGVGPVLDVYYFAFKIPDFLNVLYSVFLGSVIFIPLLTKAKFFNGEDNNKKEIIKVISSVGSFVLSILTIFFVLVFVFMQMVVDFMVPDWSAEQKSLLVDLSRILIVAQFFFPVGILGGSLGMVYKKTLGMAMSGFVYNAVILLGAIILSPVFGIYGVVYSVLAAAVCFMLVQIYPKEVREVMGKFHFRINVREWVSFFKENYLRFIAVLGYQTYGVVLLYYAAQTGVGGASMFSLSHNIYLALFFVLSSTFSQIMMPYFSENFAKHEKDILKVNLRWSLKITFFTSLLVSVICLVFSWLIIEILFYFSALSANEKYLIQNTFMIFVSSLAFLSVKEMIRKYFYSSDQIIMSFLLTITHLVGTVVFFKLTSIYFASVVATELYLLAFAISLSIIINTLGFVVYLRMKREI